jgi:thioredoxin-related protein
VSQAISQNLTNPYISELFTHIISKQIQSNADLQYRENIYATFDSTLYIMHQKGFQKQYPAGYAKISKINLFTGYEESYNIFPSSQFLENGETANHIWIWALAVSNNILFLAVDEGIWIYQFAETKQYEYVNTVPVENISKLFVVNNELHVFVDYEKGFDWLKINLSDFEITNVKRLELKNPFFLQVAPAQIIAMNNNALYVLQQNEPEIEKYSLAGEWLGNYNIKIQSWNPIPDETADTLNSMEDITERNYAFAKYGIFNYNMIHLFYVFPNERFLMIAIDRNKNDGTFITPYFIQIIGDNIIVEPYSIKLQESEKFGDRYFPFTPPRAEGNFVFAQRNEYITQVSQRTTVDWQGKTQKEYEHEINMYHRDNDPIEKMETYCFIKNYIPADSVRFLDYDDHFFSPNDIKKDKAIFIISQYPQCSMCLKMLWQYFSQQKLPEVELFNVAQDYNTYLLKKEYLKEVNTYLKTEYTPLFYKSKEVSSATEHILNQSANPLILLFDKRSQHIEVITSEHIMGYVVGTFEPSFIHTLRNFIEN